MKNYILLTIVLFFQIVIFTSCGQQNPNGGVKVTNSTNKGSSPIGYWYFDNTVSVNQTSYLKIDQSITKLCVYDKTTTTITTQSATNTFEANNAQITMVDMFGPGFSFILNYVLVSDIMLSSNFPYWLQRITSYTFIPDNCKTFLQ